MIKSLHNLYSYLHVAPKDLDEILLHIDSHYKKRSNPKKKFGDFQRDKKGEIKYRDLLVPDFRLKTIQSRISSLLQTAEFPAFMFGSIRGKNHIMNALQHLNQTFFLTIDLKNFFKNITHHQVFKMFLNHGFSPSVARILTKLTTYQKSLPQGAPSSPVIANLVFLPAAVALHELASNNSIKFSAFLDDLSFSSQSEFKHILPDILKIIREKNFYPSLNKIHYRTNICEITGLVVSGQRLKLIPEMRIKAKNNIYIMAYKKSVQSKTDLYIKASLS